MRRFGVLVAVIALMWSCSKEESNNTVQMDMKNLKSVTDTAIQAISNKAVYFAHMSVGYEIIQGLEIIQSKNPSLQFNIVETRDPKQIEAPIFAHSKIGENRDPHFKMEDFKSLLDEGLGEKLDYAFLKFCFVDVERDTDIDQLFNNYVKTVEEIQAKYPKLKLIHFTVPIRVKPNDWKGKINQFLVRDHNINRNKINNKIRAHFDDSELFDLALYQSMLPDGSRNKYTVFGTDVFILNPDFTYDGGHLNEKGSEVAAEQLLIKMAEIEESK